MKDNEFKYSNTTYKIIEYTNEGGVLIELEKREYRKCEFFYYSSLIKYRLLGILFNNNFHMLKKYMNCTNCFEKIDSYNKCIHCNIEFNSLNTPFFLNSIYYTNLTTHNEYKKLYKLNHIEEIYRDQRTNLSNPFKQEIYEKALHPDKIQRILDITNDLENLENYI